MSICCVAHGSQLEIIPIRVYAFMCWLRNLNHFCSFNFLFSVPGSIYEISGSEVCFSTGDLIKVTKIELLSVSCQDVANNETFELPISHTGWSREILVRMVKSIL